MNDPVLGGDSALYNPEHLLISTLIACHMLWYLHLASEASLCFQAYEDHPIAQSETLTNGASWFEAAALRPLITLSNGDDPSRADLLHHPVSERYFIAPSVNFPVTYAAKFQFS